MTEAQLARGYGTLMLPGLRALRVLFINRLNTLILTSELPRSNS